MKEIKYHFLAANAEKYENGFKELVDDSENSIVYWNINTHEIKAGDICYIYYSNLPDRTRRILFRGVVLESDYPDYEKKSIWKKASPGEHWAKMKIKSIAFEEPDKFSFESLKKKPYYFLTEKARQLSYMHFDKEKNETLWNDLESYKNKGHGLKQVYNLFNDNYAMCFFHEKNKCQSFIEENGFYYINRHHLVKKDLIKRNAHIKNIEDIINNSDNLFYLCPLCHAKIHNARKEEKRKMIKELYKSREKYYDKNFNQIKGNQSVLDWLYEMYKCEDPNRATLSKYINNIIKANNNKIPEELKEILMDKDEFFRRRPSHAERNYIEFSNNLVLDTNIDRLTKDKILKQLIEIQKKMNKKN